MLTVTPDSNGQIRLAGDVAFTKVTTSNVIFDHDSLTIKGVFGVNGKNYHNVIDGDVGTITATGSNITFGNDEIDLKERLEGLALVCGDARSISASDVNIIFGKIRLPH